jgi:hypothetical protein
MEVAISSRSDDLEATLKLSMERLRLKTQSHIDAWGLGKTERWDADLDEGVISFSGGGRLVTAPIQVIGTYDPEDGYWLWGWDNPTVPPPLRGDALLVRAFGERHGLSRYVTSSIRCTEDEAWQFTALACHLAVASGAYRGPADTLLVFITFHQLTIHR